MKGIEHIKTSLQIDEDLDLHIKGWIFQRIGWALMLLFLVCAALGVFGDGMLSEKILTSRGTSVLFDRYLRRENDTEVEILAPYKDGRLLVVFSPMFTKSFKVDRVVPKPVEERTNNGSTVYAFAGEEAGQLTLFLTARKAGMIHTTVRVNDIDFEIEQYVYP